MKAFMHGVIRLTRIRPNYCVFKGAFFGPNPLEFGRGDQDRGHDSEFNASVAPGKPKVLDSVRRVVQRERFERPGI